MRPWALIQSPPKPTEVQATGAGPSTAALEARGHTGDTRRQRAQGPRGRERKTHGAARGTPARAGGGRGPPRAEKGRKTRKRRTAKQRPKERRPQPPPALEGSPRPQSWVSAPSHEDPSTQRLEAPGGHRDTRDARAQVQPPGDCAPWAGGCSGCVPKRTQCVPLGWLGLDFWLIFLKLWPFPGGGRACVPFFSVSLARLTF